MEPNDMNRVLQIPPMAGNPRNSEGDFVRLADGRWLFVYTHFEGGAGDHAAAYLAGRYSDDGGVSWTQEDAVILPNEGKMNVMSVSLLRLTDGRICLVYLRKNSLTDCLPYARFSTDEAETWSAPFSIVQDEDTGYYVVNNDRLVQLSDGRLIVPTALHSGTGSGAQSDFYSPYGRVFCYLSDGDPGEVGGKWHRGQEVLVEDRSGDGRTMVQEPGVVELTDGRLMMFCRTDAGSQYVAYSRDRGETWSPLRPSDIISPRSPASIKRIPSTGDLLLVWNNHAGAPEALEGKRTPLTAVISRDEGATWENVRTLESNPHGWYCYTAIAFPEDQVMLAHSAGDRRENNGLAMLQITRFPVDWLYGNGGRGS
ncbi:MAG: sialidase family protein [Anaerolineae bacterium]